MDFEWDPVKAEANRRKHGVDFADAVEVLFDSAALTVAEEHHEERRLVTLGLDAIGRVLVVVHCSREGRIRIIPARRATRRERRRYEELP